MCIVAGGYQVRSINKALMSLIVGRSHGATQPILPLWVASEGFHPPAPAEIVIKIRGGDAMEWPQPFLQSAVVTIDVVDMKVRCFRPRSAWLR